ncbi:MAG: hypothetical protein PVG19_12580 [Desulfobacterales bacterium]|jgi:hypothetical protein
MIEEKNTRNRNAWEACAVLTAQAFLAAGRRVSDRLLIVIDQGL